MPHNVSEGKLQPSAVKNGSQRDVDFKENIRFPSSP